MDDSEQIKKRLLELSERSYQRGIYAYSEFLNLAEQDVLSCAVPPNRYRLWGGYDTAERRVACFGSEALCGYEDSPPVTCLRISPLQQKFADDLTHRDFLGSVLALGIKREMLGDIIISSNRGYIFCLDSVCDYIKDNLCKVRRTSVSCEVCDELPEQDEKQPQLKNVNVASERLDALIAAVYNISRSKSAELCAGEKVFVNGRLTVSTSAVLKNGDKVSVRGMGRFVFRQITGETKKGRLRAEVEIYR